MALAGCLREDGLPLDARGELRTLHDRVDHRPDVIAGGITEIVIPGPPRDEALGPCLAAGVSDAVTARGGIRQAGTIRGRDRELVTSRRARRDGSAAWHVATHDAILEPGVASKHEYEAVAAG